MKRPLAILGQDRGAAARDAIGLRVRETGLRIADSGDGTSAALLAEMLVAAGAERESPDVSGPGDLYIVVRAPEPPRSPKERSIEDEADLVLGSPRAAFARLLVEDLRSR